MKSAAHFPRGLPRFRRGLVTDTAIVRRYDRRGEEAGYTQRAGGTNLTLKGVSVLSPTVVLESSLARFEPFKVRWRSSEKRTDSASIGVPSLNFTPERSLIVTVRPPSPMAGRAAVAPYRCVRPRTDTTGADVVMAA